MKAEGSSRVKPSSHAGKADLWLRREAAVIHNRGMLALRTHERLKARVKAFAALDCWVLSAARLPNRAA
eukprot:6269012-Amphidinium_carterae.1